jgi:protease IV
MTDTSHAADSPRPTPPGNGPSPAGTPVPASPGPAGPWHYPPPPPRRRALAWIGWIGFLVCGLLLWSQWSARRDYFDVSEGIHEKFHSGVETGTDKVAIIAVRGIIMEGDGFVKRQIERVRKDEHVKAVVVRVDSPGGTVTGSDYIYHHLKKLSAERHIPLVVSMGSIAASGGYYVSMAVGGQAKSIFAEATTTTGSIGVIVPHYDVSGLLARYDVFEDSIASHPRKQMLSMTRKMSPDDRAIVQAYVDESFQRFKEIVKAGRPHLRQVNTGDALLNEANGRDLATGEIFTATQARQYGLVDEIGFIEDAIARAIELAGLDAEQARVIQYERPLSLSSLIGAAEASEPGLSLDTLLELSAPRAYYLATSWPPLISSRHQDEE